MAAILTNPVLIALLVPSVFLLLGGVVKKLVRGSSWRADDFYLGIEAGLAALSSAIAYLFELAKNAMAALQPNPGCHPARVADMLQKFLFDGSFMVLALGLLFWVMAEHQEWQSKAACREKQIRLMGACNAIGCGLMFVFILWVRGFE